MKQNIFLIGPASVGKSTVSKLLADELGYSFVDIDLVFCDQVELIPDYIDKYGYVKYCERNSMLVDKLVKKYPDKTIFATPAGFLVHEDSPELVIKHLKLISSNALSVLLLPSTDPEEHVKTIIERQLARYPEIDPDNEKRRYIARHQKYIKYGDIKIFGLQEPKVTVHQIRSKLHMLH